MALLADRRARLGDPAHADTAEAQIILGQTLLAAGHPAAARRHLEEAADTRRSRFLHTSYRVQEDLIWLAKAALVLGTPGPCSTCSPGRRRRPTGSATRCRSGSATPPGGWPRWPVASSASPGRRPTPCSPPGRNWPLAAGRGARPAGRGLRPVPRRARAAARRGRGRGGRAGPAGRGRDRGRGRAAAGRAAAARARLDPRPAGPGGGAAGRHPARRRSASARSPT